MKSLYVLAPQAALDLVEIWRYINEPGAPDVGFTSGPFLCPGK
jgi:hypothetical protein